MREIALHGGRPHTGTLGFALSLSSSLICELAPRRRVLAAARGQSGGESTMRLLGISTTFWTGHKVVAKGERNIERSQQIQWARFLCCQLASSLPRSPNGPGSLMVWAQQRRKERERGASFRPLGGSNDSLSSAKLLADIGSCSSRPSARDGICPSPFSFDPLPHTHTHTPTRIPLLLLKLCNSIEILARKRKRNKASCRSSGAPLMAAPSYFARKHSWLATIQMPSCRRLGVFVSNVREK